MPFDLVSSWVAAGTMVGFLLTVGVQNRRSGWQREKSDFLLDSLMLWAKATRQESEALANPPQAPALGNHPTATSDLSALHMALGSATAVAPATMSPSSETVSKTESSASVPVLHS